MASEKNEAGLLGRALPFFKAVNGPKQMEKTVEIVQNPRFPCLLLKEKSRESLEAKGLHLETLQVSLEKNCPCLQKEGEPCPEGRLLRVIREDQHRLLCACFDPPKQG